MTAPGAEGPRPFADTNVLLYLLSGDARKSDRAEALLADGLTISVQVLNEFANVARRKFGMEWSDLQRVLADLRGFVEVVPLTTEAHETGLVLAQRHMLAVYDSMIVASALHAGCKLLYSEDMHDGLRVERRLRIKNPFSE